MIEKLQLVSGSGGRPVASLLYGLVISSNNRTGRIICRYVKIPERDFLPHLANLRTVFLSSMNAHALLTSQGWRGSGHSLHSISDTIGLSRPLLVSQKQNALGVGKKQHRTSDLWWMNAFDKSLKGLDTTREGQIVQTVTNGGLDMVKKGGGKWIGKSGLYASFVRGESLVGTLTSEEIDGSEPHVEVVESKKKERTVCGTKEERRERKSAKRRATEGVSVAINLTQSEPKTEAVASSEEAKNKKERRERKRLRKLARAEKTHLEEDISKKKGRKVKSSL